MHRIQTTSIPDDSTPSHSTCNNVLEKPAKHIMTTPLRNRNEKILRESGKKSNNNDNKITSAEMKNHQKGNDLVEALPSFGMEINSNQNGYSDVPESRKQKPTSLTTKILAPCDFYTDKTTSMLASMENAENGDALCKNSSLLNELHSPQIDLSPSLLSPTAAFLLSFPVVSSTLAKPVESVSNYDESVHKIKQR